MPIYSRVIGTGSSLPSQLVTNADLAEILARSGVSTSDEWIVSRTGIRQRYWSLPEETSSQLAVRAGRLALEAAVVAPDEVDFVLIATSTPDFVFPSTACLVQEALGLAKGPAFDIQAVCSGFVYALGVADSFIRSGGAKRALVIGVDTFSSILDRLDRKTCVLFGDGAGAVVLEPSETPGVLSCDLVADGRHAPILWVPGRLSAGAVFGRPFLSMDGPVVFRLAVELLESCVCAAVAKAHLQLSDVAWFVFHQANLRILQAVGQRLGVPWEKIIVTVDCHANTSAASIPLALDVACRDGRIQKGDYVMLASVGGGFTWGASLLLW